MTEPTKKRGMRIKDARGRSVTQLDPVAMYLLRRQDVIGADVLRAIVGEKGVRVTWKERVGLGIGLAGAVLVIFLFTHAAVTGDLRGAPLAKSSSLVFLCSIPWVMWYSIKRMRFGSVAAAMLKYARCPRCGYDLRLLPTDPEDGATVCPECGCAWRLGNRPCADDNGNGASGLPQASSSGNAEEDDVN